MTRSFTMMNVGIGLNELNEWKKERRKGDVEQIIFFIVFFVRGIHSGFWNFKAGNQKKGRIVMAQSGYPVS